MLRYLLSIVAIFTALSGCALPAAQPYAALSNPPTPQPAAEATQAATGSPTARAACKVSAAQALNLRSGPGTPYSVVKVLQAGELLTLTGPQRGAWREVLTAGGVIGWLNATYCKGK